MTEIKLQNGTLYYITEFYTQKESGILFKELIKDLELEQNEIKIFGKTYNTPRMEGFYAKNGQEYGYSGKKMKTKSFTALIDSICQKIEKFILYINHQNLKK